MTDSQVSTKSDESTADSTPAVAAVSMKLPPFWAHDPTIWFAQVEAMFDTRNVRSQNTKFAHVVASLQPEYAQEVRDLLIAPPAEGRYDKLKEELVKRTSSSEQKRLQQLLTSEELGDRKPSQLLRRMQQLLGNKTMDEGVLKQLFLQSLPTNVQLILATSRDAVDTQRLAELADKIVETQGNQSPSIAAMSPSPHAANNGDLEDKMRRLTEEVAYLATIVKANAQPTLYGRGRPRDRRYGNRGRSPSRGSQGNQADRGASPNRSGKKYCWYHFSFGADARRCEQPCSYTNSPPTNAPAQQNANAQGNDQTSE